MLDIYKNILKILVPIFFLIVGISIFCFPMVLNPDKMPGEYIDARLINYILEHGYLFFNQVAPHTSFWDMPICYPMKNTLALSDVMLGGMPFYILIRIFIDSPQTSFQIFFVLMNILNFSVFYLFSRKIFKLTVFYSSFAAFLFAFSLPRYAQIFHIQLFVQYYMILSVFCFCLIKKENTKFKNLCLFFFALLFFVIQTYTAFYFAWFLGFSLPFILIAFLINNDLRLKLLEIIKCFDKSFIIAILLNFLFLVYLAKKYLSFNGSFAKDDIFYPSFFDLFFSQSFLDSIFVDLTKYNYVESMLGIGFITLFIALFAVFKSKYKYSILFFILSIIIIFTSDKLLSFLYDYFISFKAIRAYGRYIFLLIPLFAILISSFLQNQKKSWLSYLIVFLILIEQIPYSANYVWTKTEHEKRISSLNFPESCKIVGMKMLKDDNHNNYHDIDIMWYALNKRIYSLNGYTSLYYDILENYTEEKCVIKFN